MAEKLNNTTYNNDSEMEIQKNDGKISEDHNRSKHVINEFEVQNKMDKHLDDVATESGREDNNMYNQLNHARNKENRDDKESHEVVDYDQLVTAAGEFGLYQTFLIFCTFPFYIFGVFAYFGQLFLTEASPNHWCWVPELENLTALERRTLAIPLDSAARFGYSQCEMFVANWSEVLLSGAAPDQTWSKQPCKNGWEFNETEIPYPTITSEMGWVCDKASYQATAQAIFFVGSVTGGFIFGWLSDRYGRIPAAVMSNVVACVAGVASGFSKNIIHFSICRFMMGMSYDYCMMMTYLLVLEFVAPKYRSLMANLPFAIFYTLGVTSLPWIALACGHWKTLALATSLPMALALLTPFIVPESPKWLLTNGRIDEATGQIIKIARANKKKVPVQLIEQFKVSVKNTETESSASLLDLVKRPVLRNILICLCIEYMCCVTIFDALVRTIGTLKFDFFISFTLISLTECPSIMLISFILDMTGRKWLTILCLLLCSAFSVLTAFVNVGLTSVLCAVAARFTVNMCLNIAFQWGAEMLPTPVRGSAVSFIHICGFIAIILSPYIVYLEKYVSWLPLVIVGMIALLGATSALVLPETVGRKMPQTFDDAETLKSDQRMFDVPFLRRKTASYGEEQVNPCFEMNENMK